MKSCLKKEFTSRKQNLEMKKKNCFNSMTYKQAVHFNSIFLFTVKNNHELISECCSTLSAI